MRMHRPFMAVRILNTKKLSLHSAQYAVTKILRGAKACVAQVQPTRAVPARFICAMHSTVVPKRAGEPTEAAPDRCTCAMHAPDRTWAAQQTKRRSLFQLSTKPGH